MNQVCLVGNICRDNELRYSQGENATAILRNTVAVQRKFKNKETGEYESDFISIQAFGKTAEMINQYFPKGSKIGIVGEIRTGSYTNKEGNKVYTTDVIVNNVEFVSKKSDNSGSNNSNATQDNSFVDVPESIENDLPFK